METIDIFPWNENFNTGVQTIDEQHKKLVELINQLASHLAFHSDLPSSHSILDELIDYTVYHFQTEEGIWHKHLPGDDLEVEHKKIHDSFVSKVLELKEKETRNASGMLEDALSFLTNWLASHILQTDRQFAFLVQAVQSGMSLENAKIQAQEKMSGATKVLIDIILSVYNSLSATSLKLMREMVARKQSSDALNDSQTQLNKIIDSTSDLIWSVDSKTFGLRMFNRGMKDHFINRGGIHIALGMKPEDIFSTEELIQKWHDFFERALREGPYWVEDVTCFESRKFLLNFIPLEHDGEIYGIAAFGKDITDYRRVEVDLENTQSRFRAIFEGAQDGILMADSETKCFVDANPTICAMLGYEPEELLTLGVADIHPEASLPHVVDTFKKQALGEIVVAQNLPVLRKDGSVFSADVSSAQLVLDGRKYVAGFFRDITERKLAEQSLQRESEKNKILLRNASDGIHILDENANLIEASDSFCAMLGYSREEMLGMNLSQWECGYSEAERNKIFKEQFVHPVRSQFESRHRRKDGAEIDVEISGYPLELDGKPVVFNSSRDISPRKVLEAEVRRQRDFAQGLIDTAQAIILVLDFNGRIVRVNPYMEAVSGYSQDEVEGKDWFDTFLPKRDQEQYRTMFAEAIVNDIQTRGEVNPIVTRNGEERFIEWYDKTLKDAEGHPIGLLAIGQDITERKKAQDALKLLNEDLAQRVQEESAKNREKDYLLIEQSRLAALGELLHNISHHWRQPLNALAMLQANIKDAFDFGELDQKLMGKFTADGQRYIQSMSRTIDDFREFFRTSEEPTRFNLAESVRHALSIMEATVAVNEIALAIEMPTDIVVEGVFNDLSQILLNVLTNAKDAINSAKVKGVIVIWIEPVEGGGVIHVRDNGGGIPDGILDQVFDPYFTTRERSTGIGLYMSKMIIEHMGGSITIRNADDGAEVLITVPSVAKAAG